MGYEVLVVIIAKLEGHFRSLARFTSTSMKAEEIFPLCQVIRDLGEQPENRRRIREEISRSSDRSARSWPAIGTIHNRRYADFPVLHTCMQVASRLNRKNLSTQTLSHDESWGFENYEHIAYGLVRRVAVVEIGDLDAWGIFLGELDEGLGVSASKDVANHHHSARQWQQIAKAKLQDWVSTERLYFNFKNVDDVPIVPTVEGPLTNIKSLYAVAAERIWEEDRDALLHLQPLLCEKWLTHMALERRDISAPPDVFIPFLRSLLSGLSSVDLRAMPSLTPGDITDLARTCGSDWTSLDLSGHGKLQTQDAISIIKQAPNLRLLSLRSDDSSDFDLPKILEVAFNKCQIEHPVLYQRYFQDSGCEPHYTKPLIGQIVVGETYNNESTLFKVSGAADECISVLQCGTVLERLQREFTDKPPASHLDALITIENSFAVEDSNAVRPMPRLARAWTQWWLCLHSFPQYNLDCWTLMVRFRKYGAPTLEYTFAKSNKTSKRKRSEIDSKASNIVMGGLDVVAKTEGLNTTLQGMNLDVPATWTDGSARHTFLSMLSLLRNGRGVGGSRMIGLNP